MLGVAGGCLKEVSAEVNEVRLWLTDDVEVGRSLDWH
jgi:hypothetical protein